MRHRRKSSEALHQGSQTLLKLRAPTPSPFVWRWGGGWGVVHYVNGQQQVAVGGWGGQDRGSGVAPLYDCIQLLTTVMLMDICPVSVLSLPLGLKMQVASFS